MPGRIRPDDLNSDDYYTQQDYGRRHRSQPPQKNRVKEVERPQRPKFAKDDSYYNPRAKETERTERPKFTKDDSYYNPRDKYYPSGDNEPDFHPYFAKQRESSPPKRREESPPRHRHESPARYASPTRYASPPRRRHASPSRDRRHSESQRPIRSRSSEDQQHQRHVDDEHDRRSRHSGAASAIGSSRHRSSTTVPPPKSDHDPDHRPSRRDTSHYPPSSRKSHGPKRSSTQPASSHRGRASSRASSPTGSPKSPKGNQDIFMGAARAALQAGAMAAVKLQDDPSPWIGKKGTKVLTTALGAAMVDTFIEQRKPEMKGGMRHGLAKQVATFALGSLVTPAAKHGYGGHHVQKGM